MLIADTNILYEATKASMKGSSWKREPQKYYNSWLTELYQLKNELENRTYSTAKCTEFTLNERGKVRHIHGNRMRDRVVRHALCDQVLEPCLGKYLIYNNGASQKGKGISFSRKVFEEDLHRYYLKYHTNDGYIGFVDLSKFYDNIRHDKVKELIYPKIPEDTWWLMDEVLKNFEIDVSYMSDEEFSRCMDEKFDSVKYYENVPESARTGQKMMKKSVNIGDQVSQNIGVFFPTRIDNYCKIVRGLKFYGRYMDDMYFIVRTKEEAESVIDGIKERAKELGLFINDKKTHAVKLSSNYKYLQIKYSLTETGKVIKRINPVSVTRERRRLKAYKRILDRGDITYHTVEEAYKSWMGEYASLMSKVQVSNMKSLYKELFGKEPRWKKGSPSSSQTKQRSKGSSTGTTSSQARQSKMECSMTSTSSVQPSTEIPWST